MAAAIDASSPARFSEATASGIALTSASFTAPANSLIVVTFQIDGGATSGTSGRGTLTLSAADSGGLTWTEQVRRDWPEGTNGGASAIFTAVQTTSASRTVSVTPSWTINAGGGTLVRKSLKPYVITGADIGGTPVDTVGANNEGTSTTNDLTTTSVTPGATGLLIASDCDWEANGAFEASSDLTQDTAHYAGAISVCSGYKAVSSGVATGANLNAAGAGAAQHKWCQIVVLAAATAVARPRYRRRVRFFTRSF